MEKDNLRPQMLVDFKGQEAAIEKLAISLVAAKKSGESLSHTLISGPAGLGKTSLAGIIANEMGSQMKAVIATSIKYPVDIVTILVTLQENDVLFIDEVHALPTIVEETLYTALEDFRIDIIIDKMENGVLKKERVSIDLPHFTCIGATTRLGNLSAPFQDRFRIKVMLKPYEIHSICEIIQDISIKYGFRISDEIAVNIAKRCRGIPRRTINLMKSIRDHMIYHDKNVVGLSDIIDVFRREEIDERGLDRNDKRYLGFLFNREKPAGLRTIASTLNIDVDSIENNIEPYLLQLGAIEIRERGRVITEIGKAFI